MKRHSPNNATQTGIRWVGFYYFVAFASFGIYLPYLPGWLEARGITGVEFGAVVALRPLTAIVSPVLFGMVADRFGLRGSLLFVACLAASLSMGVIALLGALSDDIAFVAIFVMMGVFSFFRAPVASVADVTAVEGKKKSYGTVRLWGSLGFLISALVGGVYLNTQSQVALPATIAGAMMVSALVALRLPRGLSRPPTKIPGAARELFMSRDFRLFLATAFFWLASHAAYDTCISLHLRDLGGSGTAIGISWALGTAFEIVLMAFGGRLLSRFSSTKLLTVALIAMVLRWVAVATIPSLVVTISIQFLHALSFALVWLAALEYIRTRAAPSILATAQGSFAAVASLGSGLSMLVWGPLYETTGGKGVFSLAALIGLMAVATSVLCTRHTTSTEP